jgi:hypothetical protein
MVSLSRLIMERCHPELSLVPSSYHGRAVVMTPDRLSPHCLTHCRSGEGWQTRLSMTKALHAPQARAADTSASNQGPGRPDQEPCQMGQAPSLRTPSPVKPGTGEEAYG